MANNLTKAQGQLFNCLYWKLF